jgi:hypothetical protein
VQDDLTTAADATMHTSWHFIRYTFTSAWNVSATLAAKHVSVNDGRSSLKKRSCSRARRHMGDATNVNAPMCSTHLGVFGEGSPDPVVDAAHHAHERIGADGEGAALVLHRTRVRPRRVRTELQTCTTTRQR